MCVFRDKWRQTDKEKGNEVMLLGRGWEGANAYKRQQNRTDRQTYTHTGLFYQQDLHTLVRSGTVCNFSIVEQPAQSTRFQHCNAAGFITKC